MYFLVHANFDSPQIFSNSRVTEPTVGRKNGQSDSKSLSGIVQGVKMFEGNNNVFDKAKLDVEFAAKLRKESPTQFLTLIRMHLSFLLDMNE